MTDQESERPSTTQPGLKKSDLLTRQTGDGSFEFIVESDASENYAYEADSGSGAHDESQLSVHPRDKKPVMLIGAGILLLIVLIGAGIAFSKSGSDPAETDAASMDMEAAGFKPYGGGEAQVREARPAAARRERIERVAEPVVQPEEQFVEETYEEVPSNIVPEPQADWQVGENEQIYEEEEEELPAPPVRSIARDRINLKQVHLRDIDSEKLRSIPGREGMRRGASLRQLEHVKRSLQASDGSVQESGDESMQNEQQNQEYEEERYEVPEEYEESAVEEEYYEEEVLDDENY